MNTTFRTLRESLMSKWHARFSDIIRESKSQDVKDMTPEEAYRAGVRNGYWDAVVDMVASGLVKLPPVWRTTTEEALMESTH